nr:retrovirus-related Pol polyprotein from transposon TNT 1-94 [Tanacetum cinerariifolium]
LPKFKYHKEHLYLSCEQGKSKRASYPPKQVRNSRQRLNLLHMDLCGLMRIASINGKRKPDISFLHVFGVLCYPKNDREDIGKLGTKGDIGFFIGYSVDSCAYRVYNRRKKKIMETINVSFDELLGMAFKQRSSKLGLQSMTSGQISLGLDLSYAPSTITTQQPTEGKSKRVSHPPKPVPNLRQRLHLFHMDLCGPMRIASINGKRYVLVIVDDYSRYTWVHFLRSKDEAPEVIIKFLKRITVLFQSPVIIIRTDNGTEFKNQVLKVYFDSKGISHQMSSVRTPQQNGVVERRNRTLVEAARTMLIFSRAPLFLWAEAIATACFTQNRSIIHRRFNKTPYELINGRKLDISFLHVFGALCYPKNDREDIGKLSAKGDIGFFIGYSADSCAYRFYNRRTKKIMETMNVSFDELSAMAFEQRSSKPELQCMTSRQISSRLDLTYAPSTITKQQPTEGEL